MKLHSYKKTFIFTSLLALPLLLSAANKKYVDVTASSRNAQEFFEGFELINKINRGALKE